MASDNSSSGLIAVEAHVNVAYSKTDESSMPSTSFPDDPPTYEESAVTKSSKSEIEVVKNEKDEKILAVLRDVVRKCTNANPAKRPTAHEVLKMLEEVAPKDMLDDRLDISSDDDEEDNVKKLK